MILVLCGTSSSGKSSLARALCAYFGDGCLNFSTDKYLEMLGEKFENLHPGNSDVTQPNEVCYAKKHVDGSYEIIPGKLCSKLYETIPNHIYNLRECGFDIVIDSLITSKTDLNNYKDVLGSENVKFIYLQVSERTASEREAQRGDRLPGSAVHWLKQFTCQEECDLLVDANNKSIEEIKVEIVRYLTN